METNSKTDMRQRHGNRAIEWVWVRPGKVRAGFIILIHMPFPFLSHKYIYMPPPTSYLHIQIRTHSTKQY